MHSLCLFYFVKDKKDIGGKFNLSEKKKVSSCFLEAFSLLEKNPIFFKKRESHLAFCSRFYCSLYLSKNKYKKQ